MPDGPKRPGSGRARARRTALAVCIAVDATPSGLVERQLAERIRPLDRRSIDCLVCVIFAGDEGPQGLSSRQGLLEEARASALVSARSGRDGEAVAELAAFLARNACRAIHAIGPRAEALAGRAVTGNPIPFLVEQLTGQPEPGATGWLDAGLRRLTSTAPTVRIVPSEAAAEALRGGSSPAPAPIRAIRPGTRSSPGPASARFRLRDQWGIAGSCFLLGCLVPLPRSSAAAEVLEAFARAVEDGTLRRRAKLLVFAGNGEARDDLRGRLSALSLDGLAWVLPWSDSVEQVMEALDALVQPSSLPGSSWLTLRAMAAGKPVLAFAGGDDSELIADRVTGRLLPPGNPAELARAIAVLARDEETLERMGRMARLRLESYFDVDLSAAALSSLYAELTAKPGPESND